MEYRVIIPDEVYAVLEWRRDDRPAVCVVNQSLANFEPKIVFGWHLSIIVDCVELIENGMPARDEVPEQAGCAADGHTYREALEAVETVIAEWIETARELGRPIPEPRGRLRYA